MDQQVIRKCYEESLKSRRRSRRASTNGVHVNILDLDPPQGQEEGRDPYKKTKIEMSLPKKVEEQLVRLLSENQDVFAWTARDMPEIDPDFLCHKLSLNPRAYPVS
ncbi:hypothetical protein CR513_44782, partial [Mucuna pruriens]